MISRREALLVAAAPILFQSRPVFGQGYPAREVRVVCPLPPGTGGDITVRFFAERLQQIAGKPMLVENKTGAGGTIASEYVARSKPDGHTLYFGAGQSMAASMYQYKKLSHDVVNDFTPVTTVLKAPFVLVVAGKSTINTFPELVSVLKSKDDSASYATPSYFAQVVGTVITNTLGLKTVGVPYKSSVDAVNELNNGNSLEYTLIDSTLGFALHKQKKVRVLAVTTGERFSLEPSIPTLAESGVPGLQLGTWWGAWFPAHTPAAIVDQMSRWLNQILAEPRTAEYFTNNAPAELFPGTPESLREYLNEEIIRWRALLKAANIEPQ